MSSDGKYSLGYDGWVKYMRRVRTAARCATLLGEQLRPGMRVLDCGCGPGTITLGLAQKVAPGRVVAVDLEAGQLEVARAIAKAEDVVNIDFQEASALALPFEDGTFDAVYESTMLCHMAEPESVLRELYRVLKPGGVLSTRETVVSAMVYDAGSPAALSAHAGLLKRVIEIGGGDADLGRKMGPLMTRVGLTGLYHKVTVEQAESPEEKAIVWSTVPVTYQKLGPLATKMGWATAEALEEIARAAAAEPERADGLFAGVFVESIGWKPGAYPPS